LPDGLPKLTLGWEVVRSAAKYLRQPSGKRAGQRFEFTDNQIKFLLWWYAVDEDGQWLYRYGVRRLSKGSGKSPSAAVLALAELCVAVRPKASDPQRPGGGVGKPVDMPLVQIIATNQDQTSNMMPKAWAYAHKGRRVVDEFG